jgi:hypothetical protein
MMPPPPPPPPLLQLPLLRARRICAVSNPLKAYRGGCALACTHPRACLWIDARVGVLLLSTRHDDQISTTFSQQGLSE